MLKPAITDLMKIYNNRYSLVIAIAKRARQIASKAEFENETLVEKPVSMAIDEVVNGKCQLIDNA